MIKKETPEASPDVQVKEHCADPNLLHSVSKSNQDFLSKLFMFELMMSPSAGSWRWCEGLQGLSLLVVRRRASTKRLNDRNSHLP